MQWLTWSASLNIQINIEKVGYWGLMSMLRLLIQGIFKKKINLIVNNISNRLRKYFLNATEQHLFTLAVFGFIALILISTHFFRSFFLSSSWLDIHSNFGQKAACHTACALARSLWLNKILLNHFLLDIVSIVWTCVW